MTPARGMRDSRTKLVCTIGPATDGRVGELVRAGMDVARVNFSHGTPDEHAYRVRTVRAVATEVGRPVAVLADLAGPKIRLGELSGGSVELEPGTAFTLRTGGGRGDATGAPTSYARLAADLRVGDRVLLADGAAELRVDGVLGDAVVTHVVRGGRIGSRQGVNVPSERLSLGALTEKDRADIPRAMSYGVNFVAQSFIRRPEDIHELRAMLGDGGPPIVAKIETQAAIDRIEDILEITDAVMVARGDMGVEIPFEEVPLVQKRIIRLAVAAGVPVIVATQMLESMIVAPRPTRAEASDVANAVIDGADAVMLSAETAVGRYPLEAAEAAVRICLAAERAPVVAAGPALAGGTEDAVADAAVGLVRGDRTIAALACFTRTGRTAAVLSALRPPVPILAYTADPAVLARLALRYGVVPRLLPDPSAAQPLAALVGRVRADVAADGSFPSGSRVLLIASGAPGSPPTQVEVISLPD